MHKRSIQANKTVIYSIFCVHHWQFACRVIVVEMCMEDLLLIQTSQYVQVRQVYRAEQSHEYWEWIPTHTKNGEIC